MTFTSDNALQVNQLPLSIEFPEEHDRFLTVLTNWQRMVSNVVNTKEGALYSLQELYSYKQYFTPGNPNVFRNVYRMTFDITGMNGGAIAGAASVSFPHNIMGIKYGGEIRADCTTTTSNFFSVVGYPNVYLDTVNVYFTNPLASTYLSNVTIVAEYLKN